MNFSAPVSLALLHDLRVRPLPWAERGVLHHLSLLAGLSEDGATVHIDQRPGEADFAAWARALGDEGARLVGRLVEMGLLLIVPDGLRVVFAARSAPTPQPSPASPMDWQGKPSESPAAQRARDDRSWFRRRIKQFARVPDGMSWETWLETTDGLAHLASREITHAGYRDWVTPSVTPLGHARDHDRSHPPGHTPVTPPGHTPLARASESQIPPSCQGNPEEKRGAQTREGHTPVTPPGHTPVTPGGHTPRSHPPGHALDALRAASAGHATLTGATALEIEAGEILARHALTDADLARAEGAFADPSAWWPRGKNPAPRHVTLNDLAGFRGEQGYEWRALAALVAHLRQRKAARRPTQPAAPETPVAPPPPPPPRATLADAQRARAAIFAAKTAPLAPVETPDVR